MGDELVMFILNEHGVMTSTHNHCLNIGMRSLEMLGYGGNTGLRSCACIVNYDV